jgi:hypothetical protein
VQFPSVDAGWEMSIDTPDLQALIELSDDDLCDVIEMDAMQAVKIIRQLQTAPTLPGAGGGDALDAARYRWLREQNWNNCDLCVVVNPKDTVRLGSDCPSGDRLDAAIDAAMTPTAQSGPSAESASA